jgi:hypothetical protein
VPLVLFNTLPRQGPCGWFWYLLNPISFSITLSLRYPSSHVGMFVKSFLFASFLLGLSSIASAHPFSVLSVDSRTLANADTAESEESIVLQGWTGTPNSRGSLDIIWSCVLTISLCTWSVLCLNVPPKGEAYHQTLRRKITWALGSVAGPEVTFQLALGQWTSARHSVREFHSLGHRDWTMAHAFFADMGGIMLHTKDFPPFPINAVQLYFLVSRELIPLPQIDKQTISDKNKAEPLVRVITLVQICWFTLNCIGRTVQHLAMTTLELTTLAMIVCSLGTLFCWLHKPMDVEVPIPLHVDITMAEILIRAGDQANKRYDETPLDFLNRERRWSWYDYWKRGVVVVRQTGLIFVPRKRPLDHIVNDNFPEPSPRAMLVLLFIHMAYAGIHMCGWNFHFPSPTERLLWRISSCITIVMILFVWLEVTIVERIPFFKEEVRRRSNFAKCSTKRSKSGPCSCLSSTQSPGPIKNRISRRLTDTGKKARRWGMSFRTAYQIALPFTAYVLARVYLLAEDMATLRSLPSSAFATVSWIAFLPHL